MNGVEWRRNRELQRQQRIFNPEVRTIGIDEEALRCRVQEKTSQHESEAKVLKENADDPLHTDHTACLLESEQKKDQCLLAEDIMKFRQQFQQPSIRCEFDLNDSEVLKKQEGVRILPGLTGEDLNSGHRIRRQQEQLRHWTLQQQQELDQVKKLQSLQAQQHDKIRQHLNNRARELQKMEEEHKRATNIAIMDFNRSVAVKLQERREKEHHHEEEKKRIDILNHLQGKWPSENMQRAARPRRDCDRGMMPEQIQEFSNCQRRQAEERRHFFMEQKEKQLQEDRLHMASARAVLLKERQQARINKDLRRAVDMINIQLAQDQQAQRKKEVYTNIPDESYFSQFNKSRR